MHRTTPMLCLVGAVLLAGCSSPAEQAKAAKYEKLWQEAQDMVDVLESTLVEGDAALGQCKKQRDQLQQSLKEEQAARREEVRELKQTIERLQAELAEARAQLPGAKKEGDQPKSPEPKQE